MSSVGKKGKKGKRKKSGKKKEPPPPPPVGPWIQKLHLLDNGIDAHAVGSTLGPVMCMKMFRKLVAHLHMPSIFSKKITNVFYIGINFVLSTRQFFRLITHSETLQELDLDDNLIGDLGGREVLEALMDRKEGRLSSIL